ncbi:hypothetical protein PCANC_07587 [Puccinia coronata f. sp. avenae]|jgi:hypothetical protein|uniref:Uncharacterized protein n=1 Tax=Puccinia coronata f. sp. avenae TaxID=200324 RepID=A0A2N5VKB1_9BASI|nr:hypothetical protein PCANC_14328 [Puccinia coronata f. sp. avenae]PLW46826.1 hypothetical protein PCASD_05988 [Puccinia coronata f. sp. avenae]PLW50412.1 hypothetical protein PCANC_07587 [Puccinia coronata f. sp. avenae]
MGQDQKQQSNRHTRSSSTHSLPALGRRLSNGSLKAVKWISKQFKSNKKSSRSSTSSDSDELWGTSREIPADLYNDEPPTPSPSQGMSKNTEEAVTMSTLGHRSRRRNLENHWRDIYSFDSQQAHLPPKPTPANKNAISNRPLTHEARGRLRTLSSQSSRPSPHQLQPSPLDSLRARPSYHSVRLSSMNMEKLVSTLPNPGPPPSIPLPRPPTPTSLYPIPTVLPLRYSQRTKIYDEDSLYSSPKSTGA